MPFSCRSPLGWALTLGLTACSGAPAPAPAAVESTTSAAEEAAVTDRQTTLEIVLQGPDGREHALSYDEPTLARPVTLPAGEYDVSLRAEEGTYDLGTRELREGMTLDELINTPRPRALDEEPRQTAGRPELPEGRGEVGFALDTGGDQMGQGPREAGLQVLVEWRDGGWVQTVASCRSAGFGEPPPTATELVASCDGEPVELRIVRSTLLVTRGAETWTLALPAQTTFEMRDR